MLNMGDLIKERKRKVRTNKAITSNKIKLLIINLNAQLQYIILGLCSFDSEDGLNHGKSKQDECSKQSNAIPWTSEIFTLQPCS